MELYSLTFSYVRLLYDFYLTFFRPFTQYLLYRLHCRQYRGADKYLAKSGRKRATATEASSFIYPIYNHNWRNISTIYKGKGKGRLWVLQH